VAVSGDNVAVYERAFIAFNDRNVEGLMADCDPEVELLRGR
jgi:hypothetical protein